MSAYSIATRGLAGRKIPQATLTPINTLLFNASEPGAWYDPSDMSTLFQDAAGTIPVTAVEQPVGKMLDKSGRGNHATQATTTKRPTLKQDANGCYYLSFDGVDDAMQTGNIDFTSTDKMTVWAGVTKLSDAAVAIVVEIGISLPNGGIYVSAPNSVGATFGFASRGTETGAVTPPGYAAPRSVVLAGIGDISGDIASLRVDGIATASSADQGTGNYGNYPLDIGARAGTSLYLNGRLYSLIVRGAQSSLSQIEATELYIKQKMRLP